VRILITIQASLLQRRPPALHTANLASALLQAWSARFARSKLALLARLLRREGSKRIHQRRTQCIIRLQTDIPQLLPDLVHFFRRVSLLDQARHERRKLWLLPALRIAQLDMHETQPLESMILLDRAVHVYAALLAGCAEDGCVLVEYGELVLVLGDLYVRVWSDSDDGEESALGSPALTASASMVVEDVALQFDLDGIGFAVALQSAAREVALTLGETIVD